MAKKSKFKIVLWQIAAITIFGSSLGLLYNAFSDTGLPLIAKEPPRLRVNDPRGRDIFSTYKIGLEEAWEAFEKGTGMFIDSREEAKYVEKHIALSLNIPYDEYQENVSKLLPFRDRTASGPV